MSKILITTRMSFIYKSFMVAAIVGPLVAYSYGRSAVGQSVDAAVQMSSVTSSDSYKSNKSSLTEGEVVTLVKGWLPSVSITGENIVYHERVGLYQFMVQSDVFYLTDDGSAIIKGSVFDTAMLNHDPERANLTEQFSRALAFTQRQSDKFSELTAKGSVTTLKGVKDLLMSIDGDSVVTFPSDGPVKDTFYVFFDISCPECKRFTPEIGDLQKMGYEVKVVLVSRNGVNTVAYRNSSQLACQSNPGSELVNYMRRGFSGFTKRCEVDLAVNMDAAALLSIRGTPSTIRFSDGKLFEGLYYANELVK